MLHLLWLIPILPLAGFLLLMLFGRRLPRRVVAVVGVVPTGLARCSPSWSAPGYWPGPLSGVYTQTLWTWLPVDTFTARYLLLSGSSRRW